MPQPPTNPEEIDRLARKRVRSKLGWFIHAAVFVVVNLGLFAASQYGFGHRPWSIYPLLGWGLGLMFHGISVWMLCASSPWRENMVQRERERLQRQLDQRNQSH